MTIQTDLTIAKILYPSGGIQFRYARVMAADRTRWIRHGFFTALHENGTIASEGGYCHGKEVGLWRDFHANGQLASEGHYLDGKEVGLWRYWNSSGIEDSSYDHDN